MRQVARTPDGGPVTRGPATSRESKEAGVAAGPLEREGTAAYGTSTLPVVALLAALSVAVVSLLKIGPYMFLTPE